MVVADQLMVFDNLQDAGDLIFQLPRIPRPIVIDETFSEGL